MDLRKYALGATESGTDSDHSFSATEWSQSDEEEGEDGDGYETDSDDEKKQVRFKEGDLLEEWKSSQSLPDSVSGKSAVMEPPQVTSQGSRGPQPGTNERGVDVGTAAELGPQTNLRGATNNSSDPGTRHSEEKTDTSSSSNKISTDAGSGDGTESESEFGFLPLPVSLPLGQIEEWSSSPRSSPRSGHVRRPGNAPEEGARDPAQLGNRGVENAKTSKKSPLPSRHIPMNYKAGKVNLAWDPVPILLGLAKTLALLYCLYVFVCSLDLLSTGFRLIGGRTAGEFFSNSEIMQNPVVGVMLGILTTVFVQSSSTSTSIIVGMVAANFMTVQMAIPLIMGANIGTSITNTIVSFMQAGDRDQFERAFAGATILDMFNWISVIVLLIVEVMTGYLYHLSGAILNGLMPETQSGKKIETLSVLTDPFVNLIIQLNEEVLACWTDPTCTTLRNASLIKEYCGEAEIKVDFLQTLRNNAGELIEETATRYPVYYPKECDFVFARTSLSDAAVGAIILTLSLIVLCTCLIFIVKILSSVLHGQVATAIEKTLNAKIPYVPWLTGYLAILVGAFMTFLVQSSSVFTSAITPLIGLGVISLERAYPLTLGANIGTTTTALIASMAVDGNSFRPSMQIALVHLLFNVTGLLLFYPIPFMRFPIGMAKFLGRKTAKYRWFAILYIIVMFGVMPLVFILLSLAGQVVVIVFCSLLALIIVFVAVLTVIQRKFPTILPVFLQNWKFLPIWFRSLEPYDKIFTSCFACCGYKNITEKKSNKKTDISPPLPPRSRIGGNGYSNDAVSLSRSDNETVRDSRHFMSDDEV